MTHLGLFEGIGGFSLAAKWMGWKTKAWCEINPFCQKVLRYHYPEAEGFEDITKTDFTKYANTIDIITGGFPCQPYSVAGKRKGKEDERHLWPEMLRAIREVQPRWVVGENVLGLVNWDGGLVFHEVQTDLETAGYEVWPYVLPACAVTAPHRRDRIWFVAFKNTNKNGWGSEQWKKESSKRKQRNAGTGDNEWLQTNDGETKSIANTTKCSSTRKLQQRQRKREFGGCNSEIITNTNSAGQQKQHISAITEREGYSNRNDYENPGNWQNFPTQSPICGGDDGLPSGLDGITFSKLRNESIKTYGNAIVPQVALQIFKAIEQYELRKIIGS